MATSTAAAADLLRAGGLRRTPQRLAVVQEIMGTSGYVVAADLIRRVQAKVPGVSGVTVYRTLELLERLGVVAPVVLDAGIGYHRIDGPRHAHLTCSGCGRELELAATTLRVLEEELRRLCGFHPDFTRQAISGLCPDCWTVTSP